MKRIGIVILLLVIITSTAAAQSGWTLADIRNLRPDLSDYPLGVFSEVVLSPDGTMLAWKPPGEICVMTLANSAIACTPTPEAFVSSRVDYYLAWSPDSTRLAFTESLFKFILESDIWTFDVTTQEYKNHTDDSLTKGWLTADAFMLDYTPVWHPNGDLYFFRTEQRTRESTPEARPTVLYRLPAGSDTPQILRDLTADLPVFSIYRPPVFSPDGRWLAMIVMGNDLDDIRNGIWLFNTVDGSLRQAATFQELQIGIPEWQQDIPMFPQMLAWAQHGLVVNLVNYEYAAQIVTNAIYIDLDSDGITPLFDFTDITSQAELLTQDNKGSSPVIRIPRAGTVTPDGSAYISIHHELLPTESAVIFMLSLPPDGSDPIELGRITDFEAASMPLDASMSADGHMLARGYLLTLAR